VATPAGASVSIELTPETSGSARPEVMRVLFVNHTGLVSGAEHGLDAKALTLICGGAKPVRSPMDKSVYDEALAYREDYLATRRIVLPIGVPKDQGKA
jgi:hypothetical protein